VKKNISLLLALLLSFSLFAACGANPGEIDGEAFAKGLLDSVIDNYGGASKEERDELKEALGSLTDKWPADRLPDGFPIYPDGVVSSALTVDGAETIVIDKTGKDSFRQYAETLKDAGWAFTQDAAVESLGVYEANKDGWEIKLMLLTGSIVSLHVSRV